MNYNYTLKYRTFQSLLEDVKVDLKSLTTDGSIDASQLIKVATRINYDLGLRIYMTKERLLHVEKGRVRLPNDFYVMNFALICGEHTETFSTPQGTNIQEVLPEYRPWVEANFCSNVSLLNRVTYTGLFIFLSVSLWFLSNINYQNIQFLII